MTSSEIILNESISRQIDIPSVTTDEGRHYTIPSGKVLPSITTILGRIPNKGLEAWKERVGHEAAELAMKRGARRGQLVHDAIEMHFLHGHDPELISGLQNKAILKCFSQICDVMYDNVSEIVAMEKATWSDILGVAGRVDCIGIWNGEPAIIDFKTSNGPKELWMIKNYLLQEAFYASCEVERTGLFCPKLVTIVSSESMNDAQVFVEDYFDHMEDLTKVIAEYRDV